MMKISLCLVAICVFCATATYGRPPWHFRKYYEPECPPCVTDELPVTVQINDAAALIALYETCAAIGNALICKSTNGCTSADNNCKANTTTVSEATTVVDSPKPCTNRPSNCPPCETAALVEELEALQEQLIDWEYCTTVSNRGACIDDSRCQYANNCIPAS